MAASATSLFLSTDHLLELVLCQLDMQTILLSQRVSRGWQRVIVESGPLQQALFFQPKKSPATTSETDTGYVFNPLLAKAFPPVFTNRSVNTLEGLIHPYNEAKDIVDLLCVPDSGRADPFTRRGASWRTMLLRQPPASKLRFFNTVNDRYEIRDFSIGTIPIVNLNWPTMGTLYDLLYDLLCQRALMHDTSFKWELVWGQKPFVVPSLDDDWGVPLFEVRRFVTELDGADMTSLKESMDLINPEVTEMVFEETDGQQMWLNTVCRSKGERDEIKWSESARWNFKHEWFSGEWCSGSLSGSDITYHLTDDED